MRGKGFKEQRSPAEAGGILLVDKPEGPSSFQIVRRVKGILGVAKAGHLGTLDPFATGLLLVCINEGTKVAPFLIDEKREYEGVAKLGSVTDTLDATGMVVRRGQVPVLSEPDLRQIEKRFSGEILQIPPMFSALKRNGVPLYRLARRGLEVDRKARKVTIEGFRLMPRERDELFFHVVCSRGTYLRSLAADIGEAIGCGAHLGSLRRLACGVFRVEDSVPVDQIRDQQERNLLKIVPLRACVQNGEEVTLDESSLQRVMKGESRFLGAACRLPKRHGERLKILDSQGRLVAVLQSTPEAWRILRVFRHRSS